MTDHKNIYMALAAAQANMGSVVKGSTNPHFKSKYADLADVMQVAIPALNAEGIAPWHSVVSDEGTSYMRTTLSHGATETHIHCDVPLLVSKNDMQGMKSATTYAKRIGIESLTGIAPEDDDGNAAAQAPRPAAAQKPKPTAANFPAEKGKLEASNTMDELKANWLKLTPDARAALAGVKEQTKKTIEAQQEAA